MAKLDLSSLLETVSNLDTAAAAPELRMISLEDIQTNTDNFYHLSDLGPLADSIAMEGLQQPLVVMPHPSKEGKYRLISGHRRKAAIESLVKDKKNPREDLRMIPCMVRTYSSQAMAELQLILANSTARVLTNAETMKQAEKMEMLLYQLKEEGYEFPGRMRDQVAAACKVSAPKLARLKVIREKLYCDFMYLFEKNKLSEQAAYALARLPTDFQARISKAMGKEIPRGGAIERIRDRYEKKNWRWEPDQKCPDGKPCKRGDAFLRHDLEHVYDMCGGNKCCLKCSNALGQYSPCDRMCSKAQAQRKEKRAQAEQKSEQRRMERVRQCQAETQKNARRILPAIDACGLPDQSRFQWERYGLPIKVATVRQWAAGEFDDKIPWSGPYLSPNNLDQAASLAKLLGCSADLLLGLTDALCPATASEALPVPQRETEIEKPAEEIEPEPTPAVGFDLAAWDLLTPPAEGWIPLEWLGGLVPPAKDEQLAAVKIMVDGMDHPLLKIARWNSALKEWRYPTGVEIGGRCAGWFPLPDDGEARPCEH